MKYFAKNLIFLRKKTRTNQTQIASAVNKRQSTIANWENEDSEPDLTDLIGINQYFGISLDDLVFTDLSSVHLIEKQVVSNDRVLVHLSVHPDVHQSGQKADSKGKKTVIIDPSSGKDFKILSIIEEVTQKLSQARDLIDLKGKNKP